MTTFLSLKSRVIEARERLGAPALGAGMVDGDGHVHVHVAGTRRRNGDEQATGDDHWHIGSCGKSITAALYARLVQAGRAQWSAPLTELFPDLELHPGWAPVTIDHLLLNISGAPNTPPLPRWQAYFEDTRPPAEQRTEAAAEMFADPPDGVGNFRYSNLGYAVAGAAIERIAGEPYESAVYTHLLTPLGITTVGFGAPPAIWGHGSSSPDDQDAPPPPVDPAGIADNPAFITPAGRFHVTIADWSRFQRLFLTGADDAVLTADSVRRLLTVPPDGALAMGWAPVRGVPGVSYGQQGSNTLWFATALLDGDRRRSAMVIVNDGRTAMQTHTAKLAIELLTSADIGPH